MHEQMVVDAAAYSRMDAYARRFVLGQAKKGAMYAEFCEGGILEPDQVLLSGVRKAEIFEFPWGFVAEAQRPACGRSWSFYVQHLWRTGTEQWWAPIAAAFNRIGAGEFAAAKGRPDCPCAGLRLVGGEAAFAAASFASDCQSAACARLWIASGFLPDLWPRVLMSVTDAAYASCTFATCA